MDCGITPTEPAWAGEAGGGLALRTSAPMEQRGPCSLAQDREAGVKLRQCVPWKQALFQPLFQRNTGHHRKEGGHPVGHLSVHGDAPGRKQAQIEGAGHGGGRQSQALSPARRPASPQLCTESSVGATQGGSTHSGRGGLSTGQDTQEPRPGPAALPHTAHGAHGQEHRQTRKWASKGVQLGDRTLPSRG